MSNQNMNSIANDVSNAFATLKGVIYDDIIRELEARLDGIVKEADCRLDEIVKSLENIELDKSKDKTEFDKKLQQAMQDINLVKDDAIVKIKNSDKRLTDFVNQLQSICGATIAQGN